MNKILQQDIQGYKVKQLLSYAVGAYAIKSVISYGYLKYKYAQTKKKGDKVRQEKLSKTYNFMKIEKEDLILSLSIKELKQHLIKGTFTSVDLVHVFGQRCYTIGRELCLTAQEIFEEALIEAEKKDKEREEAIKNGTVDILPLLHGIPISIKDQYEQKGKLCTNGAAHMCDWVFEEDCPAVKLFREAGAILLVKGNLPQLTMQLHAENHIWGTAQNPYQRNRSCGGSSGGDAALVSARCAPLSFGSDLAGSIRVPAHFNGVRGFRLTPQRATLLGHRMCLPDNFYPGKHMLGTIGPFGNSTEDVIIGVKTILHPYVNRFDPYVCPSPFRDELYQKALKGGIKIGYFKSMNYCPATKSMQRGVDIAKQALQEQGYTLVPFEVTDEEIEISRQSTFRICAGYIFPPMFDSMDKHYDELLNCYKFQMWFYRSNYFLRKFILGLFRVLIGKRLYNIMKNSEPQTKEVLNQVLIRHEKFVLEMKKKWEKLGIQALIQPSYPTVSFKASNKQEVGGLFEYLNLWSCLNYNAGVVPVTSVNQDEQDGYDDDYNDIYTKTIRDDMKGSAGMPVTVTVVGMPFEDETTLAVMQAIDQKVKFHQPPQITLQKLEN